MLKVKKTIKNLKIINISSATPRPTDIQCTVRF